MKKPKKSLDAALLELREFGLAYPGAHPKSPWPGHQDVAVKDKIFVFLSVDDATLRVTCKLPHSCDGALMLPFAEPTGYGLGKSGWVTAQFTGKELPPVNLLKSWIDESYRAQAPKRLLASLPGNRGDLGAVEVTAPRRKREQGR
jgi:hypothetical protein